MALSIIICVCLVSLWESNAVHGDGFKGDNSDDLPLPMA